MPSYRGETHDPGETQWERSDRPAALAAYLNEDFRWEPGTITNFGTTPIQPPCETTDSEVLLIGQQPLGEGKRDATDIDRLGGQGASRTCTYTLDACGLGVKKALFSDDPFPLLGDKGPLLFTG